MATDDLKPNAEQSQGASATPNTDTQLPPAPSPDASQDEKTRYQKRIDSLTAARRAAEERARLLEERLTVVEQEKSRSATDVPGFVKQEPMVGQMTRSQWENWHDEDPVAAYEYIAEMKANQKAQQIIGQMQTVGAYTNTVNDVYKAHPELKEVMEGKKSPDEVPFWQVYDEVAREMPEAAQLARGPYIVMREAERRIKEKEMDENEKRIASEAAQEEANRQVRSNSSHTLRSVPRPPQTNVKLSPDEERIARKMGMTPEEYSRNKRVK